MTTIREWLIEARFDWEDCKIVYKHKLIDVNDKILDKKFDDGYGLAECPAFIAYDSNAIYFPDDYDGATSLVTVFLDHKIYLDKDMPTPYPGGGGG